MTPKQQRPISHTPPPRRVTPPPRPVTPPRRVSPPPRPVTPPPPAVTATPNQLADSTAHKERGNESFKQGQFAEAEASYTAAITALPNGHLALIPLYNNRAAARLKTGHYREAIEDCTTVQELDKKDLKCLLRRATAWEAMEKWEGARDDYELIMSADSSIKAASQGLARCRKALQPPGTSPQNAYVTNAVNAAVQKLRDQNQANEDEENLKLALKDQIDDQVLLLLSGTFDLIFTLHEQINRWRRGKEDNLRALISSLDSILWPELQWKSINLGELITPQQVKIKYMRAVSRVHPDKLSQDASVEHHLIASAVFSTLNKGWDAFKTQNGIS
ncbi:hypothetical protein DFS34DRAFT_580223 [Phlyctochytrium arcticum]|nr:hypothetical protein DFS34DRAFT_580223 [Phlyctochytrium arcticum]